jgi:transposase
MEVAMFVRAKKSGKYQYLQVVHNERVNGRVQQQVIATLGRLDVLQKTGQLDGLLQSCGRFAEHVAILDAHEEGALPEADTVRIGPVRVFERLWKELGFPAILKELLAERHFGFPVERVVFLTVLHRLFDPGSDRAAEVWKDGYAVAGAGQVDLHHFYRAMGWLGQPLPAEQQAGATPFSARCTKDLIEEAFFARRQHLFSELDLVFFDTTSIYFEGEGGESVGQYGHSKDHRPDCKQMIVGAVLDDTGRPICCELWPGNVTDVTTLLPIVDRLKKRFYIKRICIVADRGMISRKAIETLEAQRHRGIHYILGARMRRVKEVRDEVLSRRGRYQVVREARQKSTDPSPLKVKEVCVEGRRYIVCLNDEQAKKDRQDREAIVASLRDRLKQGDKSLVGNKGYRKYLKKPAQGHFEIDDDKIKTEARFDGKWVLRTDLDLPPAEVALKYKELWQVESVFRSVKTILETRPIYHKCDDTIRGHVFCSFLALVLLKELLSRMTDRGWTTEWERLKRDLDALVEITTCVNGKTVKLRSRTRGDAGKALQAVGVALKATAQPQE